VARINTYSIKEVRLYVVISSHKKENEVKNPQYPGRNG